MAKSSPELHKRLIGRSRLIDQPGMSALLLRQAHVVLLDNWARWYLKSHANRVYNNNLAVKQALIALLFYMVPPVPLLRLVSSNMASSTFKVVIVGGGVSGLTLANALEQAEVDYVLLESKEQFAPAVGASIAMGPNGNRVLDQIGCCKSPSLPRLRIRRSPIRQPDTTLVETLERHTDPILYTRTWKDGRMIKVADHPVINYKRL
jgi:hypothetical protein